MAEEKSPLLDPVVVTSLSAHYQERSLSLGDATAAAGTLVLERGKINDLRDIHRKLGTLLQDLDVNAPGQTISSPSAGIDDFSWLHTKQKSFFRSDELHGSVVGAVVTKVNGTVSWVNRFIFPFTFLWQMMTLAILTGMDTSVRVGFSHSPPLSVQVAISLTILQCVQLLATFLAVSVLINHVVNKKVGFLEIFSSFFAVILTFAGVYLCLFRVSPTDSFNGLFEEGESYGMLNIAVAYERLAFYSLGILAMQSTNFYPISHFAYLSSAIEMIMSVIYSALIFSKGTTLLQKRPENGAVRGT